MEAGGDVSATIWKFPIPVNLGQPFGTFDVPVGATFRHLANQNDELALWFEVDPDAPREQRSFLLIGTGHKIPEDAALRYLGTALFHGGTLVLHCYEIQV